MASNVQSLDWQKAGGGSRNGFRNGTLVAGFETVRAIMKTNERTLPGVWWRFLILLLVTGLNSCGSDAGQTGLDGAGGAGDVANDVLCAGCDFQVELWSDIETSEGDGWTPLQDGPGMDAGFDEQGIDVPSDYGDGEELDGSSALDDRDDVAAPDSAETGPDACVDGTSQPPVSEFLCRPCRDDSDCNASAETANRCIEQSAEGRFCGVACSDAAGCPEGYDCEAVDAARDVGRFCRPAQGEACPCDADSGAFVTTCYVENAFGRCEATRTCGDACPAPIPAAEACNGADDDCDGSTDEDLGTTTCGLGVCEHTVDDCAGGIAQECDPLAGAEEETINNIDDDCDGMTDEDPYWTVGDGTPDDPYLISTADDLRHLAVSVNQGRRYAGITFRMTQDIDLEFFPWTPIGSTASLFFSGSFDGAGHVVKNVYLNSSSAYNGLFGYLLSATISNLGIAPGGTLKCQASGTCYLGAIAGYAKTSTIADCNNQMTVGCAVYGSGFPDCHVGGIVGYAQGSLISGCSNSGVVTGSAASNTGTSSNTSNSDSNAGGICGSASGGTMFGCSNSGAVTSTVTAGGSNFWARSRAGGIVGESTSSTMTDCTNSATINGKGYDMDAYSAGIAALATGSTFTGCTNTGAIYGKYFNTLNYSSNGSSCFVGGLAASASSSSFTGCANRGLARGDNSGFGCDVGGLVGTAYVNTTFSGSYNNGEVICYTPKTSAYTIIMAHAGGIVGSFTSNTGQSVRNCYNTGAVSCTAPRPEAGGISGDAMAPQVINSYSTGNVTSTGSYSYGGGIFGLANAPFVVNTHYLTGTVTGAKTVGYYGTAQTSAFLLGADFVALLNGSGSVWRQAADGENGGYPVLTSFD